MLEVLMCMLERVIYSDGPISFCAEVSAIHQEKAAAPSGFLQQKALTSLTTIVQLLPNGDSTEHPRVQELLNAGTRAELLNAGLESEQRDRVLRQAYATCKQSLLDL